MTDRPTAPRKRDPLLKPGPVRKADWYQWTEAGAIGMEMALAIAIGFFGGRWLERHVTHWSPWTMYLGLLAGIGAAVTAIVRTARKFTRQLEAEEAAEAAQNHGTELPTSASLHGDTASQPGASSSATEHTTPREP
jgi:F0F1-type ATP synthase assembly protein I